MMIETDSGEQITVYRNRIEELTAEFTADMDIEQISQPQVFTGLLNYIYRNLFKPSPHNQDVFQKNRYPSQTRSILDYSDIEQLDAIWNMYLQLCVEYQQIPTMLDFSIMTGINNDLFTRWMNGTVENKSDEYRRTIKAWKETCESALAKRAIQQNSIGAIFALKACHSWRETSPLTPEETMISGTKSTPQEIAQRYANTPKPVLIDTDD